MYGIQNVMEAFRCICLLPRLIPIIVTITNNLQKGSYKVARDDDSGSLLPLFHKILKGLKERSFFGFS
jgi:hypothetical protein